METKCVKRLIRSKSGLRIVAADDTLQSPFLLCEPPWIPDNESSCCMECKKKFDFLTRRHHCRRCGRIYCKHCCDFRLELPRMSFVDPVRLCQGCAEVTKRENDFFDKDLKMLINGANFQLSNVKNEVEPTEFLCKLSADHRILTFDGGAGGKLETVELTRITEFNVLRTPEQAPGMFLAYKDYEGIGREMTLLASPDSNKRQSLSWLAAMHNGFKLATEVRHEV